jgi:polar amino acid transport system substrate-binding protein
MRKQIWAGIVLSAILALTAFAARAEDTIRFGIAAEPYPPFTSKDASGKWVGFEVDLMDAICAKLKTKCDIVEVAWDGIIPALQAKKFDVIWSSMSITEKRKETIDFTDSYYLTPVVMIGAKSMSYNIDYKNPESLKGKIIGVQTGTIHAQFVQTYFGSAATVKTYDTQDSVNADLAAGRIDIDMANSLTLADFLKTDAGKEFEVKWTAPKDPIFGVGVGGGILKGNTELKDKLNKALAAIRADGTYNAIAKKYFDFDVSGG